ncbi:MAG: hypothetical protein C3F15_03370 [Holophagae bacterium]|nr:MAG: hypothetical protein C3F15_03370 [Holophagae bacterium]
MAETGDELAFYRDVEDFFATIRGVPHLLSSKDFQLLRSWWREQVPLAAVTGGISEAFARRRDRGDVDPVVSLGYCRHAVARHAKRLAEMRAGQHLEGTGAAPEAPRRTPAVLAGELRTAAAGLGDARLSVARAILTIADQVEAASDLPLPMLDEHLCALESVLLAVCWRALPEAEQERIERDSAAAAAASGATGDALGRTRRAIRDRDLRRVLGLPRLELG